MRKFVVVEPPGIKHKKFDLRSAALARLAESLDLKNAPFIAERLGCVFHKTQGQSSRPEVGKLNPIGNVWKWVAMTT